MLRDTCAAGSPSSESLLLTCKSAVERDRFDSVRAIWRASTESATIRRRCFESMVDFRVWAFIISRWNTFLPKIPSLMERASDHLSIPAETVRLVFDLDLTISCWSWREECRPADLSKRS